MAEAALSFRLHYFVRSYDILSCYTQFSIEGDFIWCTLNVWFDDIENQRRPYILLCHASPFGFSAAPGIVEMAIFKFAYANIEDEELKAILDIGRFADNITAWGLQTTDLETKGEKLEELFSSHSLFFKMELNHIDKCLLMMREVIKKQKQYMDMSGILS